LTCHKLTVNSESDCSKSLKSKTKNFGSDLTVGIQEGAECVLSSGGGDSPVGLEMNELNNDGEFYL
jgi:hypothetical protein